LGKARILKKERNNDDPGPSSLPMPISRKRRDKKSLWRAGSIMVGKKNTKCPKGGSLDLTFKIVVIQGARIEWGGCEFGGK